MLKNYLIVAFRNLHRSKGYSLINISGLAIGMGVAMLIGLWIKDELSFNKYHKNYHRIAQVMQHSISNNEIYSIIYLPPVIGEEIRNNFGVDFKRVVMSTLTFPHVLTHADKKFTRTGNYMESSAPELLGLKMIRGTMDGLNDPTSIMISESVAKAFFGNEDPLNKILNYDNTTDLKITAVYEDIPANSDFKDISFITPWELYLIHEPGINSMENPWISWNWQAFVELADNTEMGQVSEKIKNITANKLPKDLAASVKPQVFLHPMSDWHLYGEFKNGVNTGGQIEFVWLFGIIGMFVLLLACINFVNLATARFQRRSKEVGIRKVVGSLRYQLMVQFFSESQLIVCLAFTLSLLFVSLTLPFFNEVAGKSLYIPWNSFMFWLFTVGFVFITGVVSGLYPAIYLSSFRPVDVLKRTFAVNRLAGLSRGGLVVLQFTVSIALIISTLVVYGQIQFARDRTIGYSRDGLITITMNPDIQKHFNVIRNELIQSGMASEMAASENTTIDYNISDYRFEWKGKEPSVTIEFPISNVTSEYGKTINWEIKEGRDFSGDFTTDSTGFILNEAAVKTMGLKTPIGENIVWAGKSFTVIGVVKDIIFESPYRPVRASIFHMSGKQTYNVTIKINPNLSPTQALTEIEKVFRKYNPSFPFEYKFVDQEYSRKFRNEERIGKLATSFSVLAIFVSCLGIFGMAAFTSEQRTKEIGIRKVLGSSVFGVWRLLSKDFVALVMISFLIATPVSYYFMTNWLQRYEYRSEISWKAILLVGVGSIFITIITVSFQAIKAALANPVVSLRSE